MGQGQLRAWGPCFVSVQADDLTEAQTDLDTHITGDSRTPHYNVSPKGENSRFVVYTCYAPVSTATQEELQLKKWLFENTKGHSHWPQALQPFVEEFVTPMRNGEPCPYNHWKPRSPPKLSERGYKLTGIPYIKASV